MVSVDEGPAAELGHPVDLLCDDPRWLLVERILATPDFVRSPRLSELLRYVCRASLEGKGETLSEQHLGEAIFGRSPHFDSAADSIVRSHALRLRQRLDQYFARIGKCETIRLRIPRGAYNVVFETVPATESLPKPDVSVAEAMIPDTATIKHPDATDGRRSVAIVPWSLAALMCLLCIGLATGLFRPNSQQMPIPWPLSAVFDRKHPTQIVLADANYGMGRIINQRGETLEEYLHRAPRTHLDSSPADGRNARIVNYIADSNLTSYADASVLSNLLTVVQVPRNLLRIRAARDLGMRDLEDGNYVLVGSPSSNPWVSLYQEKLNFRESEGTIGASGKFFINIHPLAGEQPTYRGLESTGSVGEDYATISLLPASSGHGSVLILQGLQQEGTEAAGLFLADEELCGYLRKLLGVPSHPASSDKPVYFEALIRIRTIDGAPSATTVIAARRM